MNVSADRLDHLRPFGDVAVARGDAADALGAEAGADPVDEAAEVGLAHGVAGEVDLRRCGRGRTGTARRTMSKPKPASISSARPANFSRKRSRTSSASRSGRPVPTAMRETSPSTRKRASSAGRRAVAALSRGFRPSVAASEARVAAMSSSSAIGSAKRRSAMRAAPAGAGRSTLRRGPAPGRAGGEAALPKRAASGARGGLEDLADPLQADAVERRDGLAVEAERCERQRREHRPAFPSGGDDDARRRNAQRPRRRPA